MRLSIELAPQGGQLQHIRRLVADWADTVPADRSSLALIVTELVTNALAASDGEVVIWLEQEDDEVLCSVIDQGRGLEPSSFPTPPPTSVRGRGLAIVDRLSDGLEIHRADGCTVVTARTRVAEPEEGSTLGAGTGSEAQAPT